MQQFFLKGVFKVRSQLESLNTTVSSSGRQRTNNRSQLSPSLPHGSLLPRKKKGQDGPSPTAPSYHSPSELKARAHSSTASPTSSVPRPPRSPGSLSHPDFASQIRAGCCRAAQGAQHRQQLRCHLTHKAAFTSTPRVTTGGCE